MCSLLPPLAVLSLFSFFPVYTHKYFSSSFSFSQFRLELLPSLVLPHPARLNRERENTHAGSVVQKTCLSRRNLKKGVSQHLHNYFPLFLKEAKYIPSPHWKKPESNLSSQSSFFSPFSTWLLKANPIKKLYVCVCVIDSINIYSCTVLPSRELVFQVKKLRAPTSF